LFSACCFEFVCLLGKKDYHCRGSLPLACSGCRSRVALLFARVLLVYSSCHIRVTRGRRIHLIVLVVVLRGFACMVVLFGSERQKSPSQKAAESRAHLDPPRSLPILAAIALPTCCHHWTRSSQLLHLYGCLWSSVCVNVTDQTTISICRPSPRSDLKFATDLTMFDP
jgi:Na+-transporting methylmalonyl-CoA/oxaloacetate decarboxylase gamma subunit